MIINLTLNGILEDQMEDGVVSASVPGLVKAMLTFEEMPGVEDMRMRAHTLSIIARNSGADRALISGPPYFMGYLVCALRVRDVEPVYAYTQEFEVALANGEKRVCTKHLGFIPAI